MNRAWAGPSQPVQPDPEPEELVKWAEWTEVNELNRGTLSPCPKLHWTNFPDKLLTRELNCIELMPNHFELRTRRPCTPCSSRTLPAMVLKFKQFSASTDVKVCSGLEIKCLQQKKKSSWIICIISRVFLIQTWVESYASSQEFFFHFKRVSSHCVHRAMG